MARKKKCAQSRHPQEEMGLIEEFLAIQQRFTMHFDGQGILSAEELQHLDQRQAEIIRRLRDLGKSTHFLLLDRPVHAALPQAAIKEFPKQFILYTEETPLYASDIDKFLYCQRSWWYRWQEEPSTQLPRMKRGIEKHEILAEQIHQAEKVTTRANLLLWFIVSLIIAGIVLRMVV